MRTFTRNPIPPPSTPTEISSGSQLFLLIFYGVLLALPIGRTPFYTRGEAREAQVIVAMERQHELLLPLRNGSEIPSKPPLFHWLGRGLASKLPLESASRLPSVLAAMIGLVIFTLFLRKRTNPQSAFLAAIMLASSFEWFRSAGIARVDMMFSVWTSLGTLGIFQLVERSRARMDGRAVGIPFPLLAGIICCTTLAALTKGPAGIVLPWIVGAIDCGVRLARTGYVSEVSAHGKSGRLLDRFRRPFGARSALPDRRYILAAIGAVGFSAVLVALWYLFAWKIGGDRFLDVHLMRENFARVVGIRTYNTGHAAPPYMIGLLLIGGFFPWSILFPLTAIVLWKERRTMCADPLIHYSLVWTTFYLVFFAFTASKRTVYLLPAFPAVAILVSSAICSPLASELLLPKTVRWTRALLTAVAWCVSLVVGTVAVASLTGAGRTLLVLGHARPSSLEIGDRLLAALAETTWLPLVLLSVGTFPVVAVYATRLRPLHDRIVLLAGSTLSVAGLIGLGVVPLYAEITAPILFARQVNARVPAGEVLVQYGTEFFALNRYLGRDVPVLTEGSASPDEGYVIYGKKDEQSVRKRAEITPISESRAWDVYGRDHFVLAKFRAIGVELPEHSESIERSLMNGIIRDDDSD